MIIDLLNIARLPLKDFFLARLALSRKNFLIGFFGNSRGRHERISWIFALFVGIDYEHHCRFAVKIQLLGHQWEWIKKRKPIASNSRNSDNT